MSNPDPAKDAPTDRQPLSRQKRSGGISDWAMEVAQERAMKKRRRRPPKVRKNSPVEVREAALAAQIAECINSGLARSATEERVMAWNANQGAPLAIGKVKQQVYLAYAAISR